MKRDLGELVDRIRQLTKRPDRPTNRAGADWYKIINAESGQNEVAEVFIFGDIGDDWDGVTASTFTRELRAITAPSISLHINSPGGLIFDGVAIYSALKDHPATVDVVVDGIAASAASFVAMAGDTIMVQKPAKMMIHDAIGLAFGNEADMLEMAELLDEMSDTIAAIYADRAGGEVAEWRDLMRATTWFSAEEAVTAGLADRVGGDTPADEPANKSSAPATGGGSRKALAGAVNMITRKDHDVDIDQIMAALKAITDGANAEDRALTNDEVKRYESLEVDLANKRTEAIKARMAAYEAPAPNNIRAAAHIAGPKPDNGLEKAFNSYLRTGKENADIAELRNAQATTPGAAGGFTVPEGFRQKLVDRLKAFGGIAAEAEPISTDSGNRLPWPTIDDTANEGVIAGEGAAPGSGGADLVFGERELNAYRYTAPGAGQLPLRVSVELLQDSAYDIESLVINKLGQRVHRQQARHWVQGDGTGEPQGIITGATLSATVTVPFTGGAAGATHDDLVDVMHTLDAEYRDQAVWVISDNMLKELRKVKDADGRPLWTPAAEAGLTNQQGGFLLNHRVVIDTAFDNMDVAPGLGVTFTGGVFGNITESYVIRRVKDITVIVNPYARANEGQVEYTLWARADGAVQNPWSYVAINSQTG